MKIPTEWRESKFVIDPVHRVLRGSRNPAELSVASRLVTDRAALFYTGAIRELARGDLLDLGCGKAPLLGYYAGFVDSATLVDWGNSRHANPLIDLQADLNKPLRFADQSFDTVILSDVLEHIEEPRSLLAEVSRILTNDRGVLLLNVPFYYPIHEEPFDYYRYTRFALHQMCAAVGLEVVQISSMGGIPEIAVDLASKVLQQLPFVGRYSAALIQSAGAWIIGRRIGRYISYRTAERFPIGYTLVAVKTPKRD